MAGAAAVATYARETSATSAPLTATSPRGLLGDTCPVPGPGRDLKRYRRMSPRLGIVLGMLAIVLVPSPADAHGLQASDDRSVLGFLSLGIEHMLLGWDHLLFIAGVLILARGARRAAKLITAFVLGHSATLIVATLAGWQVDAGLVDVVIVLSVVFVGLLALLGGTTKWKALTIVVLAFGLVHGLGLATRLQGLGLPEDGLLWRVIAFNVGIEI